MSLNKKFPTITQGLLGEKKPDPRWIYYNTKEPCDILCDRKGKPIEFKFLTKRKPTNGYGYFDYVIRELEPYRIYVYHYSDVKYPDDFGNLNKEFSCKTGIPEYMHHNCIAKDRRVICAGSIEFYPKTRDVKISNASGHYLPHESCLTWTEYLLNNLGYNVKDIYIF